MRLPEIQIIHISWAIMTDQNTEPRRWNQAWSRKRSFRAPAAFITPCRPTTVDQAPNGDGWAHEIKHDGYRLQIHVHGATARLYTITGTDWTPRYPLIAEAARRIKVPAIIDAEAVIQRADGVTDFEALHARTRDSDVIAFAFDLMMLDGKDLRRRPWIERRATLKKLLGRNLAGIVFNKHIEGDGPAFYAHACKLGLEGIVSKRIDAPYRSGMSKTWLKVKNPNAPGVLRFKES
jgi:bifunctional non-homologous end joining protein LigD